VEARWCCRWVAAACLTTDRGTASQHAACSPGAASSASGQMASSPGQRNQPRLLPCLPTLHNHCLFHASFLAGGCPQNLQFPSNGCQIVCSRSFLAGTEAQMYHRNFLLMDNKHRKMLVIKQSEGRKFMPKMHQNKFGGRAPPGPAGGAYALPQTP